MGLYLLHATLKFNSNPHTVFGMKQKQIMQFQHHFLNLIVVFMMVGQHLLCIYFHKQPRVSAGYNFIHKATHRKNVFSVFSRPFLSTL